MKPDLSKMSREELERIAALSLTSDPLFQPHKPGRDFEPTMADVIQYIDIEGNEYRGTHSSREKISLSIHSDRVAALKTFASNHDLNVSAAADLLFRVALGDYDEWWYHHGSSPDKSKTKEKKA